MSRPETGPMKFGDDWTGVFIRGDNSFHYAMILKEILTRLETIEEITSMSFLVELLSSPTYESGLNGNEDIQKLKSFDECKTNQKTCAKCHGLGDVGIPHGRVDCPNCDEEDKADTLVREEMES